MADKTWEDYALDLGDKIRYGKTAAEKYAELVNSPEYATAKTEADRNELLREQSARMGAEHMPIIGGIGAPLFTGLREGAQGIGAVLAGKPFLSDPNAPQSEEDMSWTSGFDPRSMMSALRGAKEGTLNALTGRTRKRSEARRYVRENK